VEDRLKSRGEIKLKSVFPFQETKRHIAVQMRDETTTVTKRRRTTAATIDVLASTKFDR
jgi:hypothetical protein